MIASVRLREIAEHLEQRHTLTAIEAFDLRAIASELACKLGYDGINDMDLIFDAVALKKKQQAFQDAIQQGEEE